VCFPFWGVGFFFFFFETVFFKSFITDTYSTKTNHHFFCNCVCNNFSRRRKEPVVAATGVRHGDVCIALNEHL